MSDDNSVPDTGVDAAVAKQNFLLMRMMLIIFAWFFGFAMLVLVAFTAYAVYGDKQVNLDAMVSLINAIGTVMEKLLGSGDGT